MHQVKCLMLQVSLNPTIFDGYVDSKRSFSLRHLVLLEDNEVAFSPKNEMLDLYLGVI